MQFHLNFKPEISQNKISHNDGILMIGSCFSEHIGKRLNDLKFNIHSNPFGIVFNPESIVIALLRIIDKAYFKDEDVFERDGKWICLEAHSSVNTTSKTELLKKLNEVIDVWNKQLKSAEWLVITIGSAYAYKHTQTTKMVANCHKLPQAQFQKQLLESDYIVKEYQTLFDRLKVYNQNLKILITVSPVKHLRDGVVENSLSKATLLHATHQIVKQNNNCFYFPAYELVNDDLRDYRFYESDMAHPNKQAIEYVWQKFSQVYFTETTATLNLKLNQIHQAMNHRIVDDNSVSTLKFRNGFYQTCKALQLEYPLLDLKKELVYFQVKNETD